MSSSIRGSLFNWLDTSEVKALGSAFAHSFAHCLPNGAAPTDPSLQRTVLQSWLRKAESDAASLHLGPFKRARVASNFLWNLRDQGIDEALAEEAAKGLLLRLSLRGGTRIAAGARPDVQSPRKAASSGGTSDARVLFRHGNEHAARGEIDAAIVCYRQVIELKPRHAEAHNNLGGCLCRRGRLAEAAEHLRRSTRLDPKGADAHSNLGVVLRLQGHLEEAERVIRRALKLQPGHADAQVNLATTLVLLGQLTAATRLYEKVLKAQPRNSDALFGLGQIAGLEGRFDDAEILHRRALEATPDMPAAWAALAGLRRMTRADRQWLTRAESIAAAGISALDEADLRFAIGKFHDDSGEYERAFLSFRRGNELLKRAAPDYQRGERERFVDEMIRSYDRQAISRSGVGPSVSAKPVFVIGMMRSGTSLAEQIIASHPGAQGAGEMAFWSAAAEERREMARRGMPDLQARKLLGETYLDALQGRGMSAARIVDKTPANADFLGLIHAVFPKARLIYMRRNPLDTCLSCFFHKLPPVLSHTMDLGDLAHHYLQHERLMAHWRAVLPPGTLLEVPYEELVRSQERWTRQILEFLELDWDPRCLQFHETRRPVATASYWQVRQRMYADSLERWRKYERFIGPLMDLLPRTER